MMIWFLLIAVTFMVLAIALTCIAALERQWGHATAFAINALALFVNALVIWMQLPVAVSQ